jgi:virginiamycin B lyase
MTPAGEVTHFNLASAVALTVGDDNRIWFAQHGAKIGRLSTTGTFAEFSIPSTTASLQEITRGPDGNIWVTQSYGAALARMTLAGSTTEYPVASDPYGIVTGPDGNLWFTEPKAGKIGRFVPPRIDP